MTILELSQEPGYEDLLAAARWFTQETGIKVRGVPLIHDAVKEPPAWKRGLYNAYLDFVDLDEDELIIHYGTPRHSGRYPWGSGEHPYQSEGYRSGTTRRHQFDKGSDDSLKKYANFTRNVERLRAKGLSNTEIARSMGITTSVFRAKLSVATDELRKEKVAEAMKLREQGLSNSAIARRMGLPNESSVRSLFEPKSNVRTQQTENVINVL